jgi:deoxyribonuclease-4
MSKPARSRLSPIGAHLPVGGGLAKAAIPYAEKIGAEAVQIFLGNPRGWAPTKGDPVQEELFRDHCRAVGIPIFIHAPYLINIGSPVPETVEKSAETLLRGLLRGRDVGASGVVVHAGSAVGSDHLPDAERQLRDRVLPILDELPADAPDLLIEPTAGGGRPLAATIPDLGRYFELLDHHPRLGVCLDTCHLYAAGHDVASTDGLTGTLDALVSAVGPGRLRLVHANDSKDPLGSNRDRHETLGVGTIGLEPFRALFRHPAMSGVPIVVETPGGADGHAADIAALKSLRDRSPKAGAPKAARKKPSKAATAKGERTRR